MFTCSHVGICCSSRVGIHGYRYSSTGIAILYFLKYWHWHRHWRYRRSIGIHIEYCHVCHCVLSVVVRLVVLVLVLGVRGSEESTYTCFLSSTRVRTHVHTIYNTGTTNRDSALLGEVKLTSTGTVGERTFKRFLSTGATM